MKNGFITNDEDRKNLIFLIRASEETLKDWYKTCTDDDVAYAQELMHAFALELQDAAIEMRIECELASMGEFSEAIDLISRVKEKQ